MGRCVAFLKAINVGGHTVKMDRLRVLFRDMGFEGVETFIASGNVLFDSTARNHGPLERTIERGLRDALGFEVPAFIRPVADVLSIARYEPFPPDVMASAAALNIGFLHKPLGTAARQALAALTTDTDAFHAHGREVYWACCHRQSESRITGSVIEKATGVPVTLRGVSTVRKLAATFSP